MSTAKHVFHFVKKLNQFFQTFRPEYVKLHSLPVKHGQHRESRICSTSGGRRHAADTIRTLPQPPHG